MEAVREWALAVCAAAVAGSLVHLVAPQGGAQKILKVTVSLFFLCCILSPVLTGALAGEFEPEALELPEAEYRAGELSSAIDEQVEASFLASLENLVRQELEELGVEPEEILVSIHTNGDGGISITEIKLTLKAEDQNKQASVEQRIAERLGQTPAVQIRREVETDGS